MPAQTKGLLDKGILQHKGHSTILSEWKDLSKFVKYEGSRLPSIAINYRFAESVAALKGFEAILINALLGRKYGQKPLPVIINTDHAQLFFMSALMVEINPDFASPVQPTPVRDLSEKYAPYFPNCDIHEMASSPYRRACNNIYKTKDNKWFHVHASLNPDPSLKGAGLPRDMADIKTIEESWAPYIARFAEKSADEWDHILGEEFRQAATICLSTEEYTKSPQGQANAGVGLYKVNRVSGSTQPPAWWPPTASTSSKRPLAGLKVVEFTRVIAGPAIGRGLAELGASVMRVTASHLPDFSGLQADLNWGKWNCDLDLRKAENRDKLKALVLEADVVINGYRPGVFHKYGFDAEQVFELIKNRERGILYVRENCFGWDGPLSHRSGWQPISDAHTGIATGFARAMGNDEAVIPVFPNSDYCTGIAGTCAVLEALMERASNGGSYLIDTSLNYYNQWLATVVGEYPQEIWEDVWNRNGRQAFRHYHSMNYTIPRYLDMVKKEGTIVKREFFQKRTSGALDGLVFRMPKPIIQFPLDTVVLDYHIGTRGNGVDQARWPEVLLTEVIE